MKIIAYHGTDESSKDSILKNGFYCDESELSKIGRRGSGAYFWKEIENHEELCLKLAYGYVHRNRENAHKKAFCLKVLIDVLDDEYFDFETDYVKSAILDICDSQNISYFETEKIGKIYNLLLSQFEKNLGKNICVYETSVRPPKSCNFPIDAIGFPKCVVVRNKNLVKVDEIFEEESK